MDFSQKTADDYMRVGRLRDAHLVYSHLVRTRPFDASIHLALGEIARHLNRPDMAAPSYRTALRLDPTLGAAQKGLDDCAAQGEVAPQPGHGVLVIKAWGAGFFSEIEHVLGGLLAAEITGRTPMVLWGNASLFCPEGIENAWNLYYEPVSALAPIDLLRASSFFPKKWSRESVMRDNVDKWDGPGSRTSALYFFGRSEEVLAADFFNNIPDLQAWIPAASPYHGKDRLTVAKMLVGKFLRLRPRLLDRIDHFWQRRMSAGEWVAVHMRGTDKIAEASDLDGINAAYEHALQQLLAQEPYLSIFLMTDSIPLLNQMKARFGDRVVCTDSFRMAGSSGVHFSGLPKQDIADQVIADAYLAARCRYFLGNGASNVSQAVEYLRDWPPGTYHLLGPDRRRERYVLLNPATDRQFAL